MKLNQETVDSLRWPRGTTHIRVYPDKGDPITLAKASVANLVAVEFMRHEYGAMVGGEWYPLAKQLPIEVREPSGKSKAVKLEPTVKFKWQGDENLLPRKFMAMAYRNKGAYWPDDDLNNLLWKMLLAHGTKPDLVDRFVAEWRVAGKRITNTMAAEWLATAIEDMKAAGLKPGNKPEESL